MKRLAVIVCMTILIVALGSTQAEAQGNRYKLYGAAAYVAPTGSEELDIGGSIDDLQATEQVGGQIGFEWRSKWWGLQLDYQVSNLDLDFGGVTLGNVDMKPLSLTVNFHLVHTKFVDFYIGPTYSWVDWGDIQVEPALFSAVGGATISTDSSSGWGLSTGVDLSVAKVIAIVIGLRYSQLDLEAEGETLPINPVTGTLGVAFRWGKR